MGSGGADVVRASEFRHAVERVDGDVHLGRAPFVRARVQLIADHLLEPADCGLGSRPCRVAGRLLPGHAPVPGNVLEMAVALRGFDPGRVARHRARTRRDDDGRFGMALGNAGVDAVLVVSAVAGERGHCARDLVEQGADLGAVIDLLGCERRGDDLARLGIQADVQLPPGPARLGAVLLLQPLARTT